MFFLNLILQWKVIFRFESEYFNNHPLSCQNSRNPLVSNIFFLALGPFSLLYFFVLDLSPPLGDFSFLGRHFCQTRSWNSLYGTPASPFHALTFANWNIRCAVWDILWYQIFNLYTSEKVLSIWRYRWVFSFYQIFGEEKPRNFFWSFDFF